MNKTYRLIWNELTRTWVAVAELVKGRGKRASGIVGHGTPIDWRGLVLKPLALAITSMGIAQAAPPALNQLPTGGQLVAGQAAISQSGSAMTINQGSNRAAIDWQSFNVGSAAQVKFIQPASSSVTLNRVLDSNPSQIFGRITANGQVFLTNPSGVYFAPGASVDVGGLVATTHSISNDDFMAGNDHFSRNGSTGSVVNDGNLTASLNGYIALLAPEVRNNGVIVAQLGTVALAAGEAYDLQFDANNTLANIRVAPATINALVENGNAVHAPGGLIILSAQAANRLQGGVVRNTGTLEASGLVNDGGSIRLLASDNIENTGALWANAAPNSVGRGGSVTLIADLSNANSLTAVDGSISVIGGDLGGDGGLIETSAARLSISNAARIDTHAPNGKGGQWLLDPIDISIGTDVAGATIATALQSGNVVLDSSGSGTCTGVTCTSLSGTGGNITVNDNINVTGGSADATLTLKATGSITVNAGKSISRTGSYKLNTVLWADSDGNSDGYIALSDAINTNGGQAWLGGGSGSTTWNGLTVGSGSAWGNATQVNGFYMYNGINMFNGSSISTGAGNVKLSGATAQTANYSIGVEIDYSGAGSASITTSSGNIDIIGTSTGNVGANVGAYGTLVQSGAVVASTAGGNVTIQGSAGTGANSDGVAIIGSVLANSGAINITGTKGSSGSDILILANGTVGYKAGSSVTASSSNISLTADTLSVAGTLQSSGTLTIAPRTTGTTIGIGTGTGTLSLPAAYFSTNFTNGFSGITVGNTAAGDISVGGALIYNDNLTLKTAGSITVPSGASLIGTSGQNATLVLWSDADANNNGYISLTGAITTNGGNAWLGGGALSGSLWNGLTVGSGSAWGNGTQQNGINMYGGSIISTGAGNIKLSGATSQNLDGYPCGLELGWHNGAASITTTSGNIDIVGTNTATAGGVNQGISVYGVTIASTGGGTVTLQGTGGNGNSAYGDYGVYVVGTVLANSGSINLIGTKGISGVGVRVDGTVGYKAGTSVTASSSNINVTSDTFAAGGKLQSSGTLTIAPRTAGTSIGIGSGTGTLGLPASYFSTNFTNGFSGITVGSPTAGDITVGGAVTYNDPLTLKTAGNITVNSGASLTGTSGQNASLILWADSDGNGDGSIWLKGSNTITTNGGHLWMGGGATDTNWNGLMVGGDGTNPGYAVGNATDSNGIEINGSTTINTAGGNIALFGKSRNGAPTAGNADGIWFNGANININSGVGTILFDGVSQGTSTGVGIGVEFYQNTQSITSAATTGDAITIRGTGTSSSSSAAWTNGVFFHANEGLYATGGGNIVITGIGGATATASNDGIYFSDAVTSVVSAGTGNLTLIVDTINASGSFSGTGSLTVKPYTANSTIGIAGGSGTLKLPASYFSTNFANGFSGITIGSATAGDITVGALALTYNDPLTLKTAGSITANAGASLTGTAGQTAHLTFWADADATNGGAIFLQPGASINSNGGNITLSGGTNIATGYAQGVDSTANLSNGITILGASIQSGGGDIALRGRGATTYAFSDANLDQAIGIVIGTSNNALSTPTLIDSGTGKISMSGVSRAAVTTPFGSGTGVSYHAIEFGSNSSAAATADITIKSASAAADAITISGDASGLTSSVANSRMQGTGFQIWNSAALGRDVIVEATAGGIVIDGKASQSANVTAEGNGARIGGSGSGLEVLAAAGPIVITGQGNANLSGSNDIRLDNGRLGYSSGTDVTSSSGNITLNGNTLSLDTNSRLQSGGILTIQPRTANTTIGIAGGAGTLQLTAANFSTNFTNGFSGITIGSATSSDITVGGAVTYKDPLTLKSARNIVLQGSLTGTASETPATHLVLWADADSGTNPGGFIFKSSTANIDTKGGHLWMGGGSGSTTWNGLTVGDGYAMGSIANVVFNNPSTAVAGTNPMGAGIWIDGGSIATGGGNIAMYGKGYAGAGGLTPYSPDVSSNNGADNNSGIASNFVSGHSFSINAGTGSIYMNGISGTTGTKNLVALYLLGGSITSAATSGTAITLYGDASGASTTAYSEGVWLRSLAGTTSVSATGGGGIGITGIGPTSAGFGKEGVVFGDGGTGVSVTTTNGGTIAISGTATQSGATAVVSTASDVINSSGALSVTGSGGQILLSGQVVVTGTTTLTGGSGNNVSLTNSTNDFTDAVTIVSGKDVSITDANSMVLSGVSATGKINAATLTNNLTIAGDVTTTDTTASAIALNAGQSVAAGTSTGGDIVLSGSPGISTGNGGRATLYTGSILGSTGLTALVGFGSGHFRYNSDESTAHYTTALGTGSYVIYREQPTISVTANDASQTYNGTAYAGGNGVSHSGFKNGDSASILTGTVSYSGSSQGAINVGSYTITPGGLGNGLGYQLAYADGSLNITATPLTAIIGNLTGASSKIYDGTTTATLTPANYILTGWLNADGATVTKSSGNFDTKDTGSNKVVTVSLTSSDFIPAGSTSLNNYVLPSVVRGAIGTIIARPLGISAEDKSKIYGQADPALTYQLSAPAPGTGLLGSDTLSGSLARDAGESVGGYAIRQGSLSAGSNYALNFSNGLLTITPATLTVTANEAKRSYGAGNPTFSGIVSGFVGTDNIANATTGTESFSTTATSASHVGNFAITGEGLTARNGNYVFTQANSNGSALTISQAPLTITANDASKTDDGSAYSGSNGVTYSGFVNGQSNAVLGGRLFYTGSSQGATRPGSYTISPRGLNSTDYVLTFLDGKLTITPAAPQSPQLPAAIQPLQPPSPILVIGPTATGELASISLPNSIGHNGGISVSLVRPPSEEASGIITVSVPKEMLQAGNGFTVPLPAQVTENIVEGVDVIVTTLDGSPLPEWISYFSETKSFLVSGVQDVALPMQVMIKIGNKRATMVISERSR